MDTAAPIILVVAVLGSAWCLRGYLRIVKAERRRPDNLDSPGHIDSRADVACANCGSHDVRTWNLPEPIHRAWYCIRCGRRRRPGYGDRG